MDLKPVKLEEFDAQLTEGKVSCDTLARLIAADADNCTASIGWLEKRLDILEGAVSRHGVTIETPGGARVLRDAAAFRAWCCENFPAAMS